MKATVQRYNLILAPVLVAGIPLLLYTLDDVPRRTVLKETLSLLTLLGFCFLLGQFYLSRSHRMVRRFRMSRVLRVHQWIGYGFTGLLLLHPFFIVVPRFFEAGVAPGEAFLTMITTFTTPGILLGLTAWGLLLLLLLTSWARRRLGLRYKTWRWFHGVLSLVFLITALWHALDLGRHTTGPLAFYLIAGAVLGAGPLVQRYRSEIKTGVTS
ncbi:MAG: FAD/NAD(P)-binding:oxidoreductase [Candidatus Neomarinimicrobiota bacterium]|nr:MAG: FAD/NAD(P)-binding:oxidoreductase [Candidatus Neomarinimicrobiota bacterium]